MNRKTFAIACLMAAPLFTAPFTAFAADPAKGEEGFKACRACHAIISTDGTVIQKGGKTGPNLYGVIGRTVASEEGFSYSAGLKEVGATGAVWDEASLAAFILDPNAWVKEKTGKDSAKSKMAFKAKGDTTDMASYLASVGKGGAANAPAADDATAPAANGAAAPAEDGAAAPAN